MSIIITKNEKGTKSCMDLTPSMNEIVMLGKLSNPCDLKSQEIDAIVLDLYFQKRKEGVTLAWREFSSFKFDSIHDAEVQAKSHMRANNAASFVTFPSIMQYLTCPGYYFVMVCGFPLSFSTFTVEMIPKSDKEKGMTYVVSYGEYILKKIKD